MAGISIHALLAESDDLRQICHDLCKISIHALLAESDIGLTCGGGKIEISIHALLAESDKFGKLKPDIGSLFLSTLSLRRATQRKGIYLCGLVFLSTLSLRRATNELLEQSASYHISIHALLAESDSASALPITSPTTFLSTLSLRRATL